MAIKMFWDGQINPEYLRESDTHRRRGLFRGVIGRAIREKKEHIIEDMQHFNEVFTQFKEAIKTNSNEFLNRIRAEGNVEDFKNAIERGIRIWKMAEPILDAKGFVTRRAGEILKKKIGDSSFISEEAKNTIKHVQDVHKKVKRFIRHPLETSGIIPDELKHDLQVIQEFRENLESISEVSKLLGQVEEIEHEDLDD